MLCASGVIRQGRRASTRGKSRAFAPQIVRPAKKDNLPTHRAQFVSCRREEALIPRLFGLFTFRPPAETLASFQPRPEGGGFMIILCLFHPHFFLGSLYFSVL